MNFCPKFWTFPDWRLTPVAMIMVLLCGCAAAPPKSQYPVLSTTTENDMEFSCSEMDDEILKANAVRDAIFAERGAYIADKTANAVSNLALIQSPILMVFDLLTLGTLNKTERHENYIEALLAATQRLRQLLIYKQDRGCPSGPTADPELTDNLILAQLQDLERQLEEEEITEKEAVKRAREPFSQLLFQ